MNARPDPLPLSQAESSAGSALLRRAVVSPQRASVAPTQPSAVDFTPLRPANALREAIGTLTRRPELELIPPLLDAAALEPAQAAWAHALALRLARGVRERSLDGGRAGLVQGLLQEFALSSQEGVALMCLAEALLRIPDDATRDALIRDKLADGHGVDWERHLGHSPSLFVNAAAWGLLLTGKLVATHSRQGLGATLRRVVSRGGEPLLRRGVDMAMRLLGEQFVTGQTIDAALARARPREAQGFRFSYDMLGEAALTADDAAQYTAAYRDAIDAIGQAAVGRGVIDGPGISIKLSALHPRYSRSQVERVQAELYPRLLALAAQARRWDIGLNIDAEESERLELSLDLLERLCFEPGLAGWNGLGFVVQAYQKRCPAVLDWLIDLARRSRRRLMLRLVKGAYWDSEIKRAQLEGQDGYPVYTRKPYTDVAYLACARRLLAAPDAVFPQFATHNAQTLAAVAALADPARWHPAQYEFQCLHGMGEPLYEQVVGPNPAAGPAGDGGVDPGALRRPCRVYAPVGSHDTLLAYLVRRLLENGANTSFVHRIADRGLPLEVLLRDPVRQVHETAQREGPALRLGAPHPAIALPRQLFGADRPGARLNSRGLDLASEATLAALGAAISADARHEWRCAPLLAATAARRIAVRADWRPLRNPADPTDIVGQVLEATVDDVAPAVEAARRAAPAWAALTPAERAARLEAAAERLDAERLHLIPLLMREAGKTAANAVAELREAVDFLRFYAAQVRGHFEHGTHRPLGPVVCISPWNFPLAIFTGQVAAALAAGNVVLAKPAEQTPLVAAAAVRALHAAGVPEGALQLLPGRGETVGAALVADPRVQAVLFTGSTEVARQLQRSLAGRLTDDGQPLPLVAETGGQNALIVDSSALAEQAVADIVTSAFDSAGQRCSALRLLCVQEEAAERIGLMLQGAIRELSVGDPRRLATDIGPVIDAEARSAIESHVARMRERGHPVWRAGLPNGLIERSEAYFVPPTLIEIGRVADLGPEVFGPVLHVLRWRRTELPALLDALQATGWGLTQGVHTRIDETVAQVLAASRAGNLYVNRNIVGAVVGVQPFGGEGLSGTGPKAGGPLILLRLLSQRPQGAVAAALAALASADSGPGAPRTMPRPLPPGADADSLGAAQARLRALGEWAGAQRPPLAALAAATAQRAREAAELPLQRWLALPGPTGETNLYGQRPRRHVLALAAAGPAGDADRLATFAAALAVGAGCVWPAAAQALADRLPPELRESITLVQEWTRSSLPIDVVVQHGDAAERRQLATTLALRPGPLVGLVGVAPGDTQVPLERLVVERSVSVNTAAAGGNAALMTLE